MHQFHLAKENISTPLNVTTQVSSSGVENIIQNEELNSLTKPH